MGRDALRTIGEFLAMGGYAAYVWPALAVSALVMVALLVFSLRSLRARQAELDALRAGRGGEANAVGPNDEA